MCFLELCLVFQQCFSADISILVRPQLMETNRLLKCRQMDIIR